MKIGRRYARLQRHSEMLERVAILALQDDKDTAVTALLLIESHSDDRWGKQVAELALNALEVTR